MNRYCVIGSGISGATIANLLSKKHSVDLFDKARGPGGRSSFKRLDKDKGFDHGTQYISPKSPAFKKFINILIKKKDFNYNLIRGGSIGFAESYMRGEFETDNLSNLIELTARNIEVIYKFSGLLDFPIINYFKNKIIKNTKSRSKENIANIMI